MNQITASQPGLPSIIERAALDPTFDIDKLQRLLDMQEAGEVRGADKAFAAALTAAEAEMETINTNARNDQTRSKYATFAQVDHATRPIYTKHGFGIQFTTEPTGIPSSILVVGMLSHRAGASRRFQVPMPITTQGFKGQAMMTETHATMAAITYGRRNLEVMMFNLQIGDDLDGNAPRRPPPTRGTPIAQHGREHVDPDTGEVIEPKTPGMVEMGDQETWQSWVPRLLKLLRMSATLDEVQQWHDLNSPTLLRLKEEKPATYEGVMAAITAFRETLA